MCLQMLVSVAPYFPSGDGQHSEETHCVCPPLEIVRSGSGVATAAEEEEGACLFETFRRLAAAAAASSSPPAEAAAASIAASTRGSPRSLHSLTLPSQHPVAA